MANLMLDREQYVNGVRTLDGMVRNKRQANAVFTFADGLLSIKVSNTVIDVRAVGDWPGVAKIKAQLLFSSINPIPKTDPVSLTVEGSRLQIGRIATLCAWTETKRRNSHADKKPTDGIKLAL